MSKSDLHPLLSSAVSHRRIQALSSGDAALMRSSTVITELSDVVLGLLKNSLDADSSAIDVEVDFARGSCTVQDDGIGIPPCEFRETSGLGQQHHTSKSCSDALHGGCGTFISLAASVSLLTIVSKHREHYSVNEVSFHRGSTISRHTPATSSRQSLLPGHQGTMITVRDLFGNVPVRIKHRAQLLDSGSQVDKHWRTLLREICALALAWSWPLTIKVKGMHSSSKPCIIRGTASNHATERHPRRDKSASEVSRSKIKKAPRLLISAGLLPERLSSTFVPAAITTLEFIVIGTVSTMPVVSKALQFISIGVGPQDRVSSKAYYEAINDVFDKSSFGVDNTEDDRTPDHQRPCTVREKDLRNRKKALDRWPIFCIDVQCRRPPLTKGTVQPHATSAIIKLLSTFAKAWLEANHFTPRRSNIRGSALSDGPRPRNKTCSTASAAVAATGASSTGPQSDPTARSRNVTQPFADWSRIKSGNAAHPPDNWGLCQDSSKEGRKPFGIGSMSTSARHHGIVHQGSLTPTGADTHHSIAMSGSRESLSPYSGARTVLSQRVDIPSDDEDRPAVVEASRLENRPSKRPRRLIPDAAGTAPKDSSSSLLVKCWENPIFPAQKEQPFAGVLPSYCLPSLALRRRSVADSLEKLQLSKSNLQNARVISQVDLKYILVKMPTSLKPGACSTLVLVDQHAASERIILEQLLQETFRYPADNRPAEPEGEDQTGCLTSSKLYNPIRFDIPPEEARSLCASSLHFARWGIRYTFGTAKISDSDSVTLLVTHLPSTISQRCVLEPRLLIDLIRDELFNACAEDKPIRQRVLKTRADHNIPAWLNNMQDIPQLMLAMLHSRACRSAVMFNDELSQAECEKLMRDLADCAFPFICAHGRVSMVPLVNIEGDGDEGEGLRRAEHHVFFEEQKQESETGFLDAVLKWQKT